MTSPDGLSGRGAVDAAMPPLDLAAPAPDAGEASIPDFAMPAHGPPAAMDTTRDIVSTDLVLDLQSLHGTATITLTGSTSQAASFEVGDLDIHSVSDADGPLHFAVAQGAQGSKNRLDVGVPAGGTRLIVDYAFKAHTQFDGWRPGSGTSFTWPSYCGNLFPCHSDPSDGLRFTLHVNGIAPGLVGVYPPRIDADSPSFVLAFAVGDYLGLDLGRTAAGTQVTAWYLRGDDANARSGTGHLRQVIDFLEQSIGPYPYGGRTGPVEAPWGNSPTSGVEYHPFFHIDRAAFHDEYVQAIVAAHGWFGDAVRLACWEDFVLSEGTTTYLALRALEKAGVVLWHDEECRLRSLCDSGGMTAALPMTCGAIDLLNDPLWSEVPYGKGMQFYRQCAAVLGADGLDAALAGFYKAHVGQAVRMKDLVAALRTAAASHGADIDQAASDWLLARACPQSYTQLCP
jgi:hypothetical protein